VRLTVTSTVKNAPASVARCVRSVRDQSHGDLVHHVFCVDGPSFRSAVRAAESDPRVRVLRGEPESAMSLAHLLPVWRSLDPESVVVWLDGDDWLAVPHALAIVARAHAAGALVTYGSFLLPDGTLGFARQAGECPRREPWCTTHLRTFRAGLVQAMRDEDFRDADGSYSGLVTDLRVMFGAIELAGPQKCRFIPNALVVYNVQTSFYVNASPEERARERLEEARVRAMAPYQTLDVFPPDEPPTKPESPGARP